MYKKLLGGIAILAIAAVAVLNVNFGSKSNGLSDVSLANVEALALECMAFPNCGTNCPYEFCGYCFGNYMLECPL